MGYYDSRRTELSSQITGLFEQLDSAERLYLPLAVGNYTNAINTALDSLLRTLEDTRVDLLKSQWDDQLKAMKAALNQYIGDALSAASSGSKPTPAAVEFRLRVLMEEYRFLGGLEARNIGFTRDLLIAHQTNLEDYTQILNRKWTTISDQNNLINEAERRILEDTQKAMATAAMEVAATRREVAEHVAAAVAGLINLPKRIPVLGGLAKHHVVDWIGGHASIVSKALSGISKSIKFCLENSRWIKERAASYRTALETHSRGVFVVYAQTRQDAEEFVRDNGFEKAKQYYVEARDTLDRWVSELSNAQKTGASDFAQAALKHLSGHLSKTERIFNTFVSTHQFKFFGPLGPDIREALTQERMWEQANAGMRSTDLESRLREWYREPVDVWVVDIERAFSQTQTELESLAPEVQAEIKAEIAAHRSQITRLVREHAEQLVSAMEEARMLTKTDTLADAFNRNPLVRALSR